MKIIKCLLAAVLPLSVVSQNIGIGTATPAASAQLDVTSTTKGVLVPRVTTAQMNAITSPADGLLVYNTTASAFAYHTASGWVFLTGNTNAGAGWSMQGNAGTNPATNFIGTTDDQPVVVRQNNIRAGLLSGSNTSWGFGALNPATTGFENTALGVNALLSNTTGSQNTAQGFNALRNNTGGSFNTAHGRAALFSNIVGNYNTAQGFHALFLNTFGSSNTAHGYLALLSNTTGSNNTANGAAALFNNSTGALNTANGMSALSSNTIGDNNTALGSFALTKANASNNTAVGFSAGADNVNGSYNVFLGNEAGRSETGSNKLYISNSNTDKNNSLIYGEFDNKLLALGGKVGIGRLPGFYPLEIQGSGTTNELLQFANSAGVGKWHLNLLANGSLNFTESGVADNRLVLGAGGNIGIGIVPDSSFPLQIKGRSNKNNILTLFNEAGAPKWNLTMEGNNLNFYETGVAERRLMLGAGGQVTIGPTDYNSRGALQVNDLGNYSGIGIGWWRILSQGYLVFNYNENTACIIGIDGKYYIASDRRLKKDITSYPVVLDKIMQLQPYNYRYNHTGNDPKISTGFMAQDVQKLFPDAVSIIDHKNGDPMLGINYQYFTIVAIKGLQEQQEMIKNQEQKINEQELRIQKLEVTLQKLLQSKE